MIAAPAAALDVAPEADEPSFREIFDAHHRFVWRTLRYLGVGDAELPDVAQEVFVVLYRKLPDWDRRAKLTTFLYGICLRVAKASRRRAQRRREVPTIELPEGAAGPDQSRRLERVDARRLLDEILSQLDDDKRAVYVLSEVEQLPMAEIAEIVGAPLQTCYSRRNAARKNVAAIAKRLGAQGRWP